MEHWPPSPGNDATPFLLRVYVKPVPFRPINDFHPDVRPIRDEFQLHVWKTNTLRELSQMLFDADPSISTPLALHAFRRIQWNQKSRQYDAHQIAVGVTRVPLASVTALLEDLDGVSHDTNDMDTSEHDSDRNSGYDQQLTASALAWDTLKDEIDEDAAAITLAEVELEDGDLLDCAVKPDPSLASAPKPGRPTARDRPLPPERYARR